jgi:hypothetical protein
VASVAIGPRERIVEIIGQVLSAGRVGVAHSEAASYDRTVEASSAARHAVKILS